MINFFRRAGLGTKLSLLTGLSVATLFLLFTFLLSYNASQKLESLAVEDLHNQSTGVVDMVQMFNTSLTEEVESYTRLFTTFLPQPLSIDASQTRAINGQSVPLLKGGDTELHENNTTPDDFLNRTGAISTLFVRSGDDFVRVATSLRKENGDRAIGTVLDHASPAWEVVNKGEVYRGLALLFGKRYITQYQPVKDAGGQVIAIIFVGVDITHSWNVMREKILSRRLGESGHFFVLNRS
ncbi:Cache 3/Cache 2 fusion domain-containing protein, partial [Leclercia sp. M50]|uniref:Cache 3/Cache 2 fusion domain-containing protein n=1 Tax=Leclercia sp. M50 TaxID=3081258 RepID=UPI00301B644F